MNPTKELFRAIVSGDAKRVAVVCQTGHDFGDSFEPGSSTWLQDAIGSGSLDMVRAMLDHGFNVNAARLPEMSTALSEAIDCDQDDIVELLLERGADPNLGRPLISALNQRKTPERRLKYVKLLVEHGADINRLYDLYGDSNSQFAALDWTSDPAVIAYLRQHGAKTAAEIKAGKEPVPPTAMAGKKQLGEENGTGPIK